MEFCFINGFIWRAPMLSRIRMEVCIPFPSTFFFYLRLAVIVLKVKVHACIMHAIDKHVEALMRGSRGGSGPGHPPPRKFKFLKFT